MTVATAISPTESNVLQAMSSFLLAVLPFDTEQVIAAQQNRVAEPPDGDFVVMTPVSFDRLATNIDQAADVKFTGTISGNILTVSALLIGSMPAPGAFIFGVGVAPGTVIKGLSGAGGNQFTVTPSQNIPSQTMSAGQKQAMEEGEHVVQLDFHSADSFVASDYARTVSTLFRDAFAADFFAALAPPLNAIAPLYGDAATQAPFVNESQQVEWRWVLQCHLQVNQTVAVPQQYADAVDVVTKDVNALFPPS